MYKRTILNTNLLIKICFTSRNTQNQKVNTAVHKTVEQLSQCEYLFDMEMVHVYKS